MSTTPDKLVERYLKHLEIELDDLPRDRRREIVDEIAGHIAEARAGLQHENEADVRKILEGLGDPVVIPFFGWFIGGRSALGLERLEHPGQDHRDPLRAGRAGLVGFLLLYTASASVSGTGPCEVDPVTGPEPCGGSSDSSGFTDVLGIVLLIAVVLAPIVTTSYLAYRLRRQPAAATA